MKNSLAVYSALLVSGMILIEHYHPIGVNNTKAAIALLPLFVTFRLCEFYCFACQCRPKDVQPSDLHPLFKYCKCCECNCCNSPECYGFWIKAYDSNTDYDRPANKCGKCLFFYFCQCFSFVFVETKKQPAKGEQIYLGEYSSEHSRLI